MRRRRFLLLVSGFPLWARQFRKDASATPAAPSVTMLSAPLELIGDWGGSPPQAAARVLSRMREVSLSDVKLVSDQQPDSLRVDNHSSGPPAIWLHRDPPKTAWIIVDIGPADWCKLAYQFGHELGHVLCNSWGPAAQPRPPTQWLEEALVEAFSIRGLGLLAESWSRNPPFPGDAGFAMAIRQYRSDLIEKYRAAAPPSPDIGACFRSHCRDFTQGKGDPLVLAVVTEMEADPLCVEDLGAVNRWPARSGIAVEEYLSLWEISCAELSASGQLPKRLRSLLLSQR